MRTGPASVGDHAGVVERNLLPLVLLAAAMGVAVPAIGVALEPAVTALLALLMLCVSLTFDLDTLRTVFRRPGLVLLATVLVYGPMGLAGYLLGLAVFGDGPLGLGFALVGVLPTDVSSPLLVLIARGNVALATVCNAINTALAPLLVPLLFLGYTGVELDVPLARLSAELAVVVLLPSIVGVALRTRWVHRVQPLEPMLSSTGSLAYLALVLAVIGPNAATVTDAPLTTVSVAALCLVLNVTGYLLGAGTTLVVDERVDRATMLFTVSKKEFSIAAVVVVASDLPGEVALPAVVYAVVQMITSPLVAHRLARDVPRGTLGP